jgi:ATP-dependent protease ClpP protease subunit
MVLFIDSLGGCPRAALTIHDMIRSSRSNVVGLVTGQCLSAAVLVFQACDWRGMLPNASMMLHQGTVGGDVTPASEFKSAVRQEIKEFNKFDELVVKRSELDERTYKKLNYTGRYLSADEAVKLKLADEVVHKR